MLGIGLYTIADAAAYTGASSVDISRWIFGYNSGKRHQTGLWRSELADQVDVKALGFHDLLEVRFVDAFRKHGVSLQAIRVASQHAREFFNDPYPFTCREFQTDGRSIFATVLEETRDETLLDLVKKQYVFKQIVKPSLYEGIEYSEKGSAARWYPLKKNYMVVLDPNRSFGHPILCGTGINTAAIVDAYYAEDENIKLISQLYEVPVSEIEAAIRFESRVAA